MTALAQMMAGGLGPLAFQPLVPPMALALLAGAMAVAIVLALWRGLSGWAWRILAGLVLLAALSGPVWRHETRQPLDDIVILLEDHSASQSLSDRTAQTEAAATALAAQAAALPGVSLRRIRIGDAPDNGGTRLATALAEAVASEPPARLAAVIALTDGQIHDAPQLPDSLPAPLHVLLSGRPVDHDRRLVIDTAPAYGLVGETAPIRLMVSDEGAVPPGAGPGALVNLTISVDGAEPSRHSVPVGELLDLPLVLDHAGANVVQITVAPLPGELTQANNTAVLSVNGLRDRLRVLLVSGKPHAGERTWRNLLKSDPAVDLVHFTILRPQEAQGGVPVDELALIAFPTEELFQDKIGEFDLIIFDRYAERGLLPAAYFDNIRRYVQDGGALLVAAGPEYATVESLWQSPLREILPARPTGRVLDQPFTPYLTDEGLRHPVTQGLPGAPVDIEADGAASARPGWGRWLRLIETAPEDGAQVVMVADDDQPLLMLAHEGEGRVALLASDHAWLWARGFDGGGPQLELLRRIAHWAMKEPELAEENLLAEVMPGTRQVQITRRTMKDQVGTVVITGPDGQPVTLPLDAAGPGRFTARWNAPEEGLYRLVADDLTRVVVLGPPAPREYEATLATDATLAPLAEATGGAVLRLADGIPDLRRVVSGRATHGRGWIGLTPRGAGAVTDLRQAPILPAWAWLLLAAGLAVLAWLIEGRGRAVLKDGADRG